MTNRLFFLSDWSPLSATSSHSSFLSTRISGWIGANPIPFGTQYQTSLVVYKQLLLDYLRRARCSLQCPGVSWMDARLASRISKPKESLVCAPIVGPAQPPLSPVPVHCSRAAGRQYLGCARVRRNSVRRVAVRSWRDPPGWRLSVPPHSVRARTLTRCSIVAWVGFPTLGLVYGPAWCTLVAAFQRVAHSTVLCCTNI